MQEEREQANEEIRNTYERMKQLEQERHAREKKDLDESIEKYRLACERRGVKEGKRIPETSA